MSTLQTTGGKEERNGIVLHLVSDVYVTFNNGSL